MESHGIVHPNDTFFPKKDSSKYISTPDGTIIYKDRVNIVVNEKEPELSNKLNSMLIDINAEIIGAVPKVGIYTLKLQTSTYQEIEKTISIIEKYSFVQRVSASLGNVHEFMEPDIISIDGVNQKKNLKRNHIVNTGLVTTF
ncbi:hypothetical protein KKD49_12130 [Myxococcota bacterium]|nr:hypothetical protein [Myxococcota bacterium]